jgi:hypothetical protein
MNSTKELDPMNPGYYKSQHILDLESTCPAVHARKRQSRAQRQRAYFDALRCTTYNLCCNSHKDMLHAENCPIVAAELELIAAEIRAIEADTTGRVLPQFRHASEMRANDRLFALGIPCWQAVL